MDIHRPPHIYKDDTLYFITSSTVNKARFFDNDEKKDILSDVIHKACERFTKELSAWTALDNHYHILVEIDKGRDVPRLVNNIHANSSRLLRSLSAATPDERSSTRKRAMTNPDEGSSTRKRAMTNPDEGSSTRKRAMTNPDEGSSTRKRAMTNRIWYQYFDRCIRDEKDLWTRFNYIHHNCVKHGYANRMEDYQYSSYRSWVKEKGIEWIGDVFASYPILDFSVEGEVE